MGPIPFTAIAQYCTIYNIGDGEDFDDFLYLIRAMDSELIKIHARKSDGKN